MLHIERLRIRLPHGYAHRANSISQHVGELLKGMDSRAWPSVESLDIPTLKIGTQTTDSEIARLVVNSIRASLQGDR